ncbi:hypothetical protein Micbo1qcDRAFT_177837 [Microdochium bolleyi]|uniref:Uncharacterized protein n=1 Tax=Microdochium bolleyi TaxID=196109 RepID=A0A136IV53_9PEZI|nr:hypothetical protein Micbo1qcDRAFT_177837 [Microdochium bolleyi]
MASFCVNNLDDLTFRQRQACAIIQSLEWSPQSDRGNACAMILAHAQGQLTPSSPHHRVCTRAELGMIVYDGTCKLSAVALVTYAERELGKNVVLDNAFIHEHITMPTIPVLTIPKARGMVYFTVGRRTIEIDSTLCNPDTKYRQTMTPALVRQHWSTQRELIRALCELQRWPADTEAWLLRQVQYHDPTRPPCKARLRAQLYSGDGPSLYGIILHWAHNLGHISASLQTRIAEKKRGWLLTTGPMAVVLSQYISGEGSFDCPTSPDGKLRLRNDRIAAPRHDRIPAITVAMLYAHHHGGWPWWFVPNDSMLSNRGAILNEIEYLGYSGDIDVAGLKYQRRSCIARPRAAQQSGPFASVDTEQSTTYLDEVEHFAVSPFYALPMGFRSASRAFWVLSSLAIYALIVVVCHIAVAAWRKMKRHPRCTALITAVSLAAYCQWQDQPWEAIRWHCHSLCARTVAYALTTCGFTLAGWLEVLEQAM